MAPPQYLISLMRKVLLLYFVLFLFTSCFLVCAFTQAQPLNNDFPNTRRLLELQQEDQPIKKSPSKNQTKLIKPTTISSKNQTKLTKTTTISAKNQTKLIKLASSEFSTKNKTKLIKPTKDSTNLEVNPIKSQLKKLSSTSKTSNSTKHNSNLANNSSDLIKSSSPKNKTTKPISTKQSQIQLDKNLIETKSKNPDKNQVTEKKPKSSKTQKPTQPSWNDQLDDVDDLLAEFRDLPSKFQETLLPDLERISTTSKVYLSKANKEITNGFKPIVGKKYAPTIASIACFAFILIPLILVSLLFNRIKAYFSLQKLLIFIQIYLCIYFSILCLSSLVTGLEPLRFFYATSQSTYVCVQVMQTLGYVLYLLLLLMYLILVFSTETGPGSKMLGLGQTFVGFAVGLHYYVTVFHRVVLRQPPKTNWKVHMIYATCFLVICLLATADRRKKAYMEEGGEEGKKS
ncbi:uncharacterized protein LOC130768571 [Actinidia eriantha]|uniref:uncharacterized protein LOC130768571 n=1 Tax=Actinidia eriantha TaxID=165200 RepID=UPI00258D3AE8|nr:uncharacterized protein LOC130768571 [Actinidia eriantha]